MVLSGISPGFPGLSPSQGQITHVLLTRSPLYSRAETLFLARLACVKHAASVRSEPGSNSPLKLGVREGVPYPDERFDCVLYTGISSHIRGKRISYCLAFKEPTTLGRCSCIGIFVPCVKSASQRSAWAAPHRGMYAPIPSRTLAPLHEEVNRESWFIFRIPPPSSATSAMLSGGHKLA